MMEIAIVIDPDWVPMSSLEHEVTFDKRLDELARRGCCMCFLSLRYVYILLPEFDF